MASSSSLSLSSLPLPSSSGLRSRSHRDPAAAIVSIPASRWWPGRRGSAAAIVSIPASRWWQGRRGSAAAVAASAARKKYKGTVMREEKLAGMIERKVEEAKAACEGEEGKGSDGCKVAWDEVEEVSQAMSHLRRRLAESDRDPLESFCQDNPETDECRVYED